MFRTLGLIPKSNVYFQADESGGGSLPTPPPVTPPATGTPTPDQASGVTQADIDKAAAAARKDGERQAAQKLLTDLGFEKVDDLKAMITAFKEKQQAELSETDRLKQQLADEQALRKAAEDRVTAAQHQALIDRRNTKVVEALGSAKYPKLILNDLEKDGKLEGIITDAGDIDEKAIEKLVIEAKKAMPDLFRSDAPGSPSHAGAQPQNLTSEAYKKAAEETRLRARL